MVTVSASLLNWFSVSTGQDPIFREKHQEASPEIWHRQYRLGEFPGASRPGNEWVLPTSSSPCTSVPVHLQLPAQRTNPPPDHGPLLLYPCHAG